MSKVQDKQSEMLLGSGTPEDDWLDNTPGYKVRQAHLELLGLTSLRGKKILDVGCGPGTYGLMLAQCGNEVVGVEISPASVQEANRRAKEKGVTFTAQVGDLEKLPFADNTFDVCFCGWVLHHFPDVDASVSELARVLKPGGVMAMVEPNETNAAMRFSRFVEDLPFMRKWVLKEGWDTPNRTINTHKQYVDALAKYNIKDIKVSSCFPGGLPTLPPKTRKGFKGAVNLVASKTLVWTRRLLFTAFYRLTPRPRNGADLLITGIKN